VTPRDARHDLRLPVRASAVLAFGAGRFEVIAEDLAAGGCGFVSPLPLRRGEAVHLTIRLPGGPLSAHATVAWARPGLPHRAGVTFARSGAPERARTIRALLTTLPTLTGPLPPLRPGAHLRVRSRPAPEEVLTREERAVLEAAEAGATALDLLRTARDAGVRRALLHLRARGIVAEGPALSGPGRPAAAPPQPPPPLPPPRSRPTRATACLEMARAEQAAGHLASSVEWLQGAAAAAPGDAEIQDALDALTLRGEP
jgi:hypothetical protein